MSINVGAGSNYTVSTRNLGGQPSIFFYVDVCWGW